MSNWSIRDASARDLEAVERTLQASDLPLDGLRDQFGARYAVAESGGMVIGVEGIEVHGRDGLLRSAAVVKDWRGRGVGDALTRDRIEWARREGLDALYLLTTTAGDWFPRFGFVAVARDSAPVAIRESPEFADACPASALFMQLVLNTESNQ
jgi:N-acetylglutamate synthase-like GNAT family acetyltransferase